MQAAAGLLELGSQLWSEACSAPGSCEQLLSSDSWQRYITALGHVYFVALVVRAAAERAAGLGHEDDSSFARQLAKGWQRCDGHWQLALQGLSCTPELNPRGSCSYVTKLRGTPT